jgi:methenyltetrahydromethanopterin cyclohydrolase
MRTLNERAYELCNAIVADADMLGIAVSTLDCGTRIIDCGVKAPGSMEAGRRLAEVCLAGRASVTLRECSQEWSVTVNTDDPIAACMASQYAGWQITGEKFFAMGSGPMRAAAGREEIFSHIGHKEVADHCVGVLETGKVPPDAVCQDIAQKCSVSPDRLTLAIARTSSVAGTVQIVARSVETALHKLHTLGFDLSRVKSGRGNAPVPPIGRDDMSAIGLTNDAILYGGTVRLVVDTADDEIAEIGPKLPSNASPDYGQPFVEIFARYDHDFYRIDPMLFSPAEISLSNVRTGRDFVFGAIAPKLLAESFTKNSPAVTAGRE